MSGTVNGRTREWRDSDEGGNFALEEEVTTAARRREMKNDTITHSSWSVCVSPWTL